MPNYQNGKIYKIVNSQNTEIYIGSTVRTLAQRMALHRAGARKTSQVFGMQDYMAKMGIDKFRIVLLESFPCANKDELRAREQYHIDLLKPSLNTRNALQLKNDDNDV